MLTDDLELALPMGARVFVASGLRLPQIATDASLGTAQQFARAIAAWSGPGAVVIAGDMFDFRAPGHPSEPAQGSGALLALALDAHPTLRDALHQFSAGPGRRVVVLPGERDAWLGCSVGPSDVLAHATGAAVAPAVLAVLGTPSGHKSVRIEPGHGPGVQPGTLRATSGPGRMRTPAEPGRQYLADVLPGVWRGSTSGWLAGMNQLDDPEEASRFIASRLIYRQLGRRAWLLSVPVLLALLVRLPVALLRPAHHFAGPLMASALAVAALELAVLLALAAVSLRQIWLAFSGKLTGPRDLNESARAAAREMVGRGLGGLVRGGTCRAELSSVGPGFYANPGCCGDVVSEHPPRFGGAGLPSPFLGTRQVAWVEIDAGNELHTRLLYGQVLLPGATVAERLLARARAPRPAGSGRPASQPSQPGTAAGGVTAGEVAAGGVTAGEVAAGGVTAGGVTAGEVAPRGGPIGPAVPTPAVVASFPHGQSWPQVPGHNVPHRRTRRFAAVVVAAAGFLSVLATLSAPAAQRLSALRQVLPLAVPQTAGALAVLGGLGLIMLARGIRRGQHRAYVVCQLTLVTVAVLHLVRGGSLATALVGLAVAGFLWLRRASFKAASDIPAVHLALARLAFVGMAAVAAGTLALEGTSWFSIKIHHRHLARIGWEQAFLATTERMIGVQHVPLPDTLNDLFTPVMLSVTAGLVVASAWLAFRPVVAHRPSSGPGEGFIRARGVIEQFGGGTLDYFALRSDKQFYFLAGSVVAYAVYSGICLVSPDPIGPLAQREAVWRSFRAFADSNGWAPAVLGASEEWLPIYRSTGMHDLYLGDEAVVLVKELSLQGGKFKGLRQAVNRVARHGYTISFHDPADVQPDLAAELEDVMTKSRRGGVERGFSMTLGRIFDQRDKGLLLAVVHGPGPVAASGPQPREAGGPAPSGPVPRGPAVAFCQYVPAAAINGFSLDLMRRDNGEHPNGLIDFAIVETVQYLAARGYEALGLNFATMRAVLAGGPGGGIGQRAQAWLLRRMSGSMQIETLWRFNAKFDPEWLPRYAVYDSAEHALPVALAVARAESFWELPLIGRFLVPSAQRRAEASEPSSPRSLP